MISCRFYNVFTFLNMTNFDAFKTVLMTNLLCRCLGRMTRLASQTRSRRSVASQTRLQRNSCVATALGTRTHGRTGRTDARTHGRTDARTHGRPARMTRPFGRPFKTNQIQYANCNSETTFGPNPIQGVWLCSAQLSSAQPSSDQLSSAQPSSAQLSPAQPSSA